MFFLAAAAIFPFCQHDFRLGRARWIAAVLILALIALVLQAALPEQYDFLLDPRRWRDHAKHYVSAKLTVFMISVIPPLAASSMFALIRTRRQAVSGILLGIIAVSLVASAVLVLNSEGLVRTKYSVAADWYGGVGRAAFSTISMGFVLIFGSVAALAYLSGNSLRNLLISTFAGFCLLGTIMLDRRIDTIAFLLAVVVIICIWATIHEGWRRAIKPLSAIFLIPILSWPIVTNEFNIEYWQTISTGLQYRAEAAANVLQFNEDRPLSTDPKAVETKHSYQVADAGDQITTVEVASAARAEKDSDLLKMLLGGGLGLYAAKVSDTMLYPHNILLEMYLELGVIAPIVFLSTLALLLFPLARKILNRTIEPEELVTAALSTVLFALSLKSGDISSVGNVLFFAIIAGSVSRRHNA